MSKATPHRREDRLTEYSRDRLKAMVQNISESRNPVTIVAHLRCELRNMIHDYEIRSNEED